MIRLYLCACMPAVQHAQKRDHVASSWHIASYEDTPVPEPCPTWDGQGWANTYVKTRSQAMAVTDEKRDMDKRRRTQFKADP